MMIRPLARGALIVGGIVVGSALIVGSLFADDAALFGASLLLLPPVLGVFAAVLAGHRESLLAVAAVTFAASAIAFWFALGPDGRAEGGAALIILWLVPAELIGLVVTDAVLRAVHRRRRMRRLASDTGRTETL
jgi:hypothetical protein